MSIRILTLVSALALVALAAPAQADIWHYVPGFGDNKPPFQIVIQYGDACTPDDATCLCSEYVDVDNEGPTDLDPEDGELNVPLVPNQSWLYVCANF
jgi:hypothetical protein